MASLPLLSQHKLPLTRPTCGSRLLLSSLASSLASVSSQVVWSLGRWKRRVCSLDQCVAAGRPGPGQTLPRAGSEMAPALWLPGRALGMPTVVIESPALGASRGYVLGPWRVPRAPASPGLVVKWPVHLADFTPVGKAPIVGAGSRR